MKKLMTLAASLFAVSTYAQVQKIDLQKEFAAKDPVDLYETSALTLSSDLGSNSNPNLRKKSDKNNILTDNSNVNSTSESKFKSNSVSHSNSNLAKNKKLPLLSQLKDFELHSQWNECVKLAPQVFQKQKEVRGWVALSWLRCLEQEQKKKDSTEAIERAFTALNKYQELSHEGPWSHDLEQLEINLRLALIEKLLQKKNQKAVHSLDALLDGSFALTVEQKAQIYQSLGDLALARNSSSEASFFYEESQNQKSSKDVQQKLDELANVQENDRRSEKGPDQELSAANEKVKVEAEESKLEEHMRQAVKKNDTVTALNDVLFILNRYPGSRTAKHLKDKPLEIYISLTDKSEKLKALNAMEEADGVRLLEWAQSLHRRGDYSGSLHLSQKMAEKNLTSPSVTSALWIAGRSAHFLGQYSRALAHFDDLIKYHNGSDEAAEALFRSGLIHFRKKKFTLAANFFERLLAQGRDRYDLSSRYWLYRSLQETNSDKAKTVREDLIGKYPFSYYGLRLRAEAQEGKLSWPEPAGDTPKLEHELYLVGSQKKSWQRFKILSDAGWVVEAQAEIANRPFIKQATLKLTLAKKMAERHQYAVVIRLLNEAMESDPRLRREEFVKLGYPQVYTTLYQAEADRYKIPATLLRSLTRQESAFNLQAVSTSNAMGLMQMIPPTAQEVSRKLGLKIQIPDDMFRPQVNIPMGSYYVAQMLEQFQGNIPFALAAYNAGPHRLKNWLEGRTEIADLVSQPNAAVQNEVWFDELPWNETSLYVKAILRNILLYRLVEEGSFTLKPALWADIRNKKDE
ncbi:MAG: lytic transglycosylase domain-containing protein [Bdellovibrio sp.]